MTIFNDLKSKGISYHRIIFWMGVAIWLAGSAYGGWQKEATTAIEGYSDALGVFLMAYGAIGDIFSGVTISKDTNVKTPKVDVIIKNAFVQPPEKETDNA